MIKRKEMQEVVKGYREPISLILGSHSALDAGAGARNFGLRRIIYTTPGRAEIYLSNPLVGELDEPVEDLPSETRRDMIVRTDPRDIPKDAPWRHCVLILDDFSDVLKYQDDLVELECIQIPNRAFSVYVGGEACRRIEEDFAIPIMGSRRLLKIENREEVEENYYWFLEKAGIPYPEPYRYLVDGKGVRFDEYVDQPLVFKAPFASRKYERGFVFAPNSRILEEKIREEVEMDHIAVEDLRLGRVEEIIPGVTANFNFFFSPLYSTSDWGELSNYIPAWKLANEFLSIDERRETTHDGIIKMLAEDQMASQWSKTIYPVTFEVTAHCPISLRESLLRFVHPIANRFLRFTKEYEPPGIIGAYCIQTMITYQRDPQERVKDLRIGLNVEVERGVYDVPEGKTFYDFLPITQDVATRHGGGTNTHMGLGSQYANVRYNRRMSMGDRIAMEIKRAWNSRLLQDIVT